MPLFYPFVLLLCTSPTLAFTDTGVRFLENFTGFQFPGDLDYDAAYKAGKAAGNVLSFDLEASITNVTAWSHNSTHVVALAGNLTATNITMANISVSGQLQLFPLDVSNNTLTLKYFLPFKGKDGKDYHLEGLMTILGYDCVNLLRDLTTMYCHIKTGKTYGQGAIVTTGIVQMPPETILPAFRSMQPINHGTTSDWVSTLGKFWGLVGKDVLKLCLSKDNNWNFWYAWGSQGTNGFLVDMIKSPTQLELRLGLYSSGSPVVLRQLLPLSAFNQSSSSVTMGPLTLTPSTLIGSVNGTLVNLTFDVSQSKNQFLPPLLGLLPTIIPNMTSHYGSLTKDGVVAGVGYSAKLPAVQSSLNLGLSMDVWAWSMVSAMDFPGTDLQLEVVGWLLPGAVVGMAFVRFEGREFHLNDPLSNITVWTKTGGEDDSHQLRDFSLKLVGSVLNNVQATLDCSAPTNQFALLDRYGLSVIHSTVVGKCSCTISVNHHPPQTFVTQNALLEVKNFEN